MENISWLTDMRNVYQLCKSALQKQELIRKVFDISLYYKKQSPSNTLLHPEAGS